MMLKSTRLLLCERATDIGEDKVSSAPNKQADTRNCSHAILALPPPHAVNISPDCQRK